MANIGNPMKQWDVTPEDAPQGIPVPETVPQKQETPEEVPV